MVQSERAFNKFCGESGPFSRFHASIEMYPYLSAEEDDDEPADDLSS